MLNKSVHTQKSVWFRRDSINDVMILKMKMREARSISLPQLTVLNELGEQVNTDDEVFQGRSPVQGSNIEV